MRPDTNKSTNAVDKMKTVKVAWNKAAAGPNKDAAHKHHQAVEKAQTAKNAADTHKSLHAATCAVARHRWLGDRV